jgi:anaerobic selenocysteine-containing dehydrogenase
MQDYKEWRDKINREAYHEGEWQWQEGEYTVTRSHHWSAPGCHNSCGLLFYTKDGKVEKVEGDPLEPYNNGSLCMRCLNYVESINHPDRLKWPLKRVGERGENKWERISWEEAADIIVENVNRIKAEYGGESIVGVHGTGRNVSWQTPYFFFGAFDTPNVVTMFFSGFSCYLPRVVGCNAVMGDFMIADASEVHEERFSNPEWKPPGCIVIWGCEPLKSNGDGFLGHWLVQCVQRGSKIVCIDPQLTWWASRADYWLPLRPGTDAAMALGILNTIISEDLYDHDFVEKWTTGLEELAERAAQYPAEKVAEICNVPSEKIKAAARFIAKNTPTALQWGLAFEQQVDALSAILGAACLPALTGSIDVPGGMNIVRNAYNTHRHYNCGMELLSPGQLEKKLQYSKSMSGNHMVAHANPDEILKAMESGKPYPIKMMWFQSSNPLACPAMEAPRAYEAMKKLDFVVVADPFMTPTAVAHADLVLPVAMNNERNSTRTWWTPLRAITQVSSYYEAKSDEQLILYIGKKLNPKAFPFEDDKAFVEWYITKDGDYPGTWEELRSKGYSYWDWDQTLLPC